MRALVTGANGFVGRHLVAHLSSHGDEIIPASAGGDGYVHGLEVQHLDIREPSECLALLKKTRPEAIYNLAGMAFVPDAERDFAEAVRVNVVGAYNLLKANLDLGLKAKVVLVSSSEVFSNITPEMLPLTEVTPPSPKNNYGLTKLMMEEVANKFLREDAFPVTIIRAFNHIGPGQRPDFVVSSFAKQIAEILLGLKEPVIKVGNLDAKRDFTDVRDIVRGYRLAAIKGSGTYNLCSGRSYPISDLLNTLIQIAGTSVSVEIDPQRVRKLEVAEIRGENSLAGGSLNWQPEIPIEQSLRDAIECFKKELKMLPTKKGESCREVIVPPSDLNEIEEKVRTAKRKYGETGPQTGIFTDGGANPNPGAGGWGYVWVEDGKVVKYGSGRQNHATNNQMELSALIAAFKATTPEQSLTIYSDSELCVKTVNEWAKTWERNGWKRKGGAIANLELVKELYQLKKERPNLQLRWIAGHAGWLWNEVAHELTGEE